MKLDSDFSTAMFNTRKQYPQEDKQDTIGYTAKLSFKYKDYKHDSQTCQTQGM